MNVRGRLIMLKMDKKRIVLAAVSGGVVIFFIKLLAYLISGSVALLSDALESVVNIAASCMMFCAVRLSEPWDTRV